ncbi:hypothetical protein HDV02_003977 [Globomyces sp. JEL0801]|nr:hypothetical protein HDV02_003977 [Globomyces sp. JEL0801]
MNISNPVSLGIEKVHFSFYEPEELKKLSVKAINNPQMFDTLDHPCSGGLYDPALGPHNRQTLCATCLLDEKSCPGHFGHIDLTVPVYNTITFKLMYKLLQSTCHYCHHLRVSDVLTHIIAARLKLLHAGLIVESEAFESYLNLSVPGKSDEKDEDEEADNLPTVAASKETILEDIKKKVNELLENSPKRYTKATLLTEAVRKLERQYMSMIPPGACANCRGISPRYRNDGDVRIFQRPLGAKNYSAMLAKGLTMAKLFHEESNIAPDAENDALVTPITVRKHLERLWVNEKEILDLLYGKVKSGVPVAPTRFRPVSKLGDQIFEHPQNIHLTDILKTNDYIRDIENIQKNWLAANSEEDAKTIALKKQEFLKQTVENWIKLQASVNFLIDSSKAPAAAGKVPPPGVRQLLEKKEGLFRKHMMGKRVNFAARSVISPDPYIETNEIGQLRSCVINGPDVWPGATHVQNEDGSLIALGVFDEAGRTAIANQLLTSGSQNAHAATSFQFKNTNKKVLRHLRNGDFLLLNRQPTLHKPSIMAHTARILPGEKTIRMHYANCNTYNADFDGDEMNAHFPQNEIARAEAMLIARNDQQYFAPTAGGVLRGLIQDHVDAGVDMCSRDTFFSKSAYIQLVYAALRESNAGVPYGNGNIESPVEIGRDGRICTLPPAIMKPVPRWTGKQVISTILLNMTPKDQNQLNLVSKSKIPAKQWGPTAPEEQTVLFMDGQLLTGILDKSQFGASAKGLVHAVHEVYGPVYAGKLLSILGRLFTAYLQSAGFSCRMDDLLLTPEGDKVRKDLINSANTMGHLVATEYVNEKSEYGIKLGLESVLRDSEKMAGLDSAMKSKTNKVTSEIIGACVPDRLYKPFPHNNMQVMTVSGAKGSSVNVSQISCLLGQQELEGKRVPTMVSGKTLPSFLAFDTSARSGGYITGRFLTGIKPQEYYFHCMAGREGLIDTAVKTSRSGYLQRCLIKHLEGLKVHYDHTVRDTDGSILQFHYGEDSLDVVKQTTLNNFEFNAMNYRSLVHRYSPTEMEGKIDESTVKSYLKQNKASEKRDPVLSLYSPSKNIGAVSEKFQSGLDKYIESNRSKLLKDKKSPARSEWSGTQISKSSFKTLMHLKYMHALVEPGESVGLLAAQSIGEPSTQMTLNTFHFAGFGAKNVTLGIPRLREIIMTASQSIKTPLMTLPLKDSVTDAESEKLCADISKLVLSQVMTGVTVSESLTPKTNHIERKKIIKITLNFWNAKHYLKQYGISKETLGNTLELKFIPLLERAISKELKERVKKDLFEDDIGVAIKQRSVVAQVDEDEDMIPGKKSVQPMEDLSDNDPDSDMDAGDAEESKSKSRKQQSSYEDDTDESDDDGVEKDADAEEPKEVEEDVDEDGKSRHSRIVSTSKFVTGFKFFKNGESCEFKANVKKILMVALCERVCENVVIHEVDKIQRCFPQPNESENDTSVNLGTEGCNLKGMWDYSDLVDINKIYTNDIAAVLRTYGVEAARSAITQEIASVFGVYGIDVDSRHLSLIGDYMTFEGGYKPFNRMGMESNPSPFTQMSFERTTHFLTTATLAGDFDPLDSPSARLVMGQVVKGGTGAFDVIQPIH